MNIKSSPLFQKYKKDVILKVYSAGYRDSDNLWVEPTSTSYTIPALIQPVGERERNLLSEGALTIQDKKCYISCSDPALKADDEIVIDGEKMFVVGVIDRCPEYFMVLVKFRSNDQ